jgi:hypothetical protein
MRVVGVAQTVLMRAVVGCLVYVGRFVVLLGNRLPGVDGELDVFVRMCRRALHCNSSERLNRNAQCEEQDEEEFAPVRHGAKV